MKKSEDKLLLTQYEARLGSGVSPKATPPASPKKQEEALAERERRFGMIAPRNPSPPPSPVRSEAERKRIAEMASIRAFNR